MQIFTQHAYIPRHILTDKGTAFTAHVLTELIKQSGIKIDHATIKHAQTIGMIERNHQKLKQILKINVAADTPQWDRYVNLAIMAHNTTYHQTLKCSPSEIFHGRVPYNALDLKYSNPLQPPRNSTDIKTLVDNVNKKFKETHDNIIEAFHKYKAYYDRKAQAEPLKVGDFTFLLNPKYSQQSDKVSFTSFQWEGPYKVVKVLSNSNYIIRKTGTHKTQCVHRMRLRPFIPHDKILDIEMKESSFYPDPDAADDSKIFNENIPHTPKQDTQNLEQDSESHCESEAGVIVIEHKTVARQPQPLTEQPMSAPATHQNDIIPTEPPVEQDPPIPVHTEQPDELTSNSSDQVPNTRSNATRYNLRSNPQPRTYRDFLAHEISRMPVFTYLHKAYLEQERQNNSLNN